MHEAKEPVKLYLDDDKEPFKVAYPPLRFHFNTISLPDGPHRLRIEASNGLAPPTIREVPFWVRNGVAISVYGLEQNQTIAGQVEVIINAYAGNTEVDFEPRRAETPQPIPTWAWVVFLGVAAWAMFYVLNPTVTQRSGTSFDAPTHEISTALGARMYFDTCARCHGEEGEGHPGFSPALRDNPRYSVAPTPDRLLVKVAMGGSVMPDWGTRLTNEELISVVNFLRTSWGHASSEIRPRLRYPPEGIATLENQLATALKETDREKKKRGIGQCCWVAGTNPGLFRTDGVRAQGVEEVQKAWETYVDELGAGQIRDFQLTDAWYDYEPSTVEHEGSIVVAWGRIFLDTMNARGQPESAKGRFIRVYRKVRPKAKNGATDAQWSLVFDFADIPMNVGCLPNEPEECPPGVVPGGTSITPSEPSIVTPPPEGATVSDVGFAEVIEILKKAGKRGGQTAPHGRFWDKPYDTFVHYEFEDEIGGDGRVRVLVPYDSKRSNLPRVLRGQTVFVRKPDGSVVEQSFGRMPVGGPPVPAKDIETIERWIDAGAPERAGEPSKLPREDATAPSEGTGRPSGAPAPGGTGDDQPGGFPPPGGDQPGGFPPPGGDQPGGFPPPGGDQPGGFPPPGGDQPGGFPPPGGDRPGGFPPPGGGQPGGFPPPGGDAPQQPGGFPPPDAPREGDGRTARPVEGPIPSYADIRGILEGLGVRVRSAPHGEFWTLPHARFVAFEFPLELGGDEMVRLIEPGHGEDSNLVKALRDGRGIVVRRPDGSTSRVDIGRMPPRGKRVSPEDLAKIVKWIDAGAPEQGRR